MREIDILENNSGWALPASLNAWIHPFFKVIARSDTPYYVLEEAIKCSKSINQRKLGSSLKSNLDSRHYSNVDIKQLAAYSRLLFEWLATTDQASILVAEETNGTRPNYTKEQTWQLMRQAGYKGDILYYETKDSDPTPQLSFLGNISLTEPERFSLLTRAFRKEAVRHLLLGGGMFKSYAPHWPRAATHNGKHILERTTPYPDFGEWGCVNFFAKMIWSQSNDHRIATIEVTPITFD
jgi:hypothetical protein